MAFLYTYIILAYLFGFYIVIECVTDKANIEQLMGDYETEKEYMLAYIKSVGKLLIIFIIIPIVVPIGLIKVLID